MSFNKSRLHCSAQGSFLIKRTFNMGFRKLWHMSSFASLCISIVLLRMGLIINASTCRKKGQWPPCIEHKLILCRHKNLLSIGYWPLVADMCACVPVQPAGKVDEDNEASFCTCPGSIWLLYTLLSVHSPTAEGTCTCKLFVF